MASEKDNAVQTAGKLIGLLKTGGIDVGESYIFGSVISDTFTEDSDIDIAIVSKDFTGIPYYDVQKISRYRRSLDLRLEIHPFSSDDIAVNPPSFFIAIRNKGIRLT